MFCILLKYVCVCIHALGTGKLRVSIYFLSLNVCDVCVCMCLYICACVCIYVCIYVINLIIASPKNILLPDNVGIACIVFEPDFHIPVNNYLLSTIYFSLH